MWGIISRKISIVGGAVIRGTIGALTEGWEGMVEGVASGFMWGAIIGEASGYSDWWS